jgi:hypothetical protein
MKRNLLFNKFSTLLLSLLIASCQSEVSVDLFESVTEQDVENKIINNNSQVEAAGPKAKWNGFGGRIHDMEPLDDDHFVLAKGLKGVEVVSSLTTKIVSRYENKIIGNEYRDVAKVPQTNIIVATQLTGVELIDFSDVNVPKLLSSYDTPGVAVKTIVSSDGSKLFVADGSSGIQVLDISNPNTISLLGTFDTTGGANDVFLSVDEQILYVADFVGLEILDISDFNSITSIGNFASTDLTYSVVVNSSQTRAYLTDNNDGVKIVDISNPASPVSINTFNPGYIIRDIALSTDENILFIGGSTHFLILDITNELSLSTLSDSAITNVSHGITISSDESFAYICDELHGLRIFDIQDKSNPINTKNIETLLYTLYITMIKNEKYAIISDYLSIKIIDMNDEEQPQLLTVINQADYPSQVTLNAAEDKMFVVFANMGLAVYDITEISSPVLIGSVFTMNGDYNQSGNIHLSADEQILYTTNLRNFTEGLEIFDISDLTNPTKIGGTTPGRKSYRSRLSSNEQLLFMADGVNDLVIMDVSDAANPVNLTIANFTGMNEATDVELNSDESIAYIIDSNGLYIVDVSDPSAPVQLNLFGSLSVPSQISMIANDSKVFISDQTRLQLINVSDSMNPFVETTLLTHSSNFSYHLNEDKSKVYTAEFLNGLTILNYDGANLSYTNHVN